MEDKEKATTMESAINAMEQYICDQICRHPFEVKSQEELDAICFTCSLAQYTGGIRTVYDHLSNGAIKAPLPQK